MATPPLREPAAAPAPPAPGRGLLVIVVAGVVLAFLAAMLSATGGHFVPQVTDLYLVCQYAKAMAEGHPFRYNAGDPRTGGATSLAHTALLGIGHAIGIRGEWLIALAVVIGAACYLVTVLLAARIGGRLGGTHAALLAGVLAALSGPVAWGFLSGSDVGLAMLLATWLLERMLAGWEEGTGWIVPAALLALTRPEALVAVLVLGGAWVLGPGAGRPRRGGVRPWLPALAALALLLSMRLLTGQWVGSSLADKSLLANYSPQDAAAIVADYLTDVARGVLLGFYPRQTPVGMSQGFAPFYFPPLALLLVVAAAALAPAPLRRALATWLGVAALLFVLVAPNTFLGVHYNRYLMWAFPGLLALTGAGLVALVARLVPLEPETQARLLRGCATVLVALGALSVARFASVYADLAGQVARRDVAAAQWIKANLPRGVRMANLATSVEYLTGHYAINLHGVTSASFFGTRSAEREAGTFEALQRLPEAERPPYLIVTVSALEALPTMRAMVVDPPLFRTASFGDEIEIFRLRYDALGRSAQTYLARSAAGVQGLRLVDRLNVCDAVDEAAHGYEVSSSLGDLRLHGAARIDRYEGGPEVIDGGRVVLGSESFDVATTPGRDLVVLIRTARDVSANVLRPQESGNFPLELNQAGLVVAVDGNPGGRFDFAPSSGWDEVAIRIPAALVTRTRSHLELHGRYASFYYWFYQ